MSMQAVIQDQPGGVETLKIASVAKPVAGPGQLLVKVMASGINRADLMQREGKYPPPPGVTEIIGLEVAGVVEEAPADSRFQPGDAVFGLIAGGGYAEYAVLDEALAVPKPDWLSWVEAASLPEAWMTAWFNLVNVGKLAPGETTSDVLAQLAVYHAAQKMDRKDMPAAGVLRCHSSAAVTMRRSIEGERER